MRSSNKETSKGNFGKVKAAPHNKKKASKLPKLSTHHDAKKPTKKRRQFVQSSRTRTHKGFKIGYNVSEASASKNSKTTSKPIRKEKKRKKKCTKSKQFQMSMSQSNEIYLKRVDVPWYSCNARSEDTDETFTETIDESSGIFNKNTDDEDSDDQSTNSNERDSLLKFPTENILSSIDADIESFCAYIKLSPIELKARQAFLDEITGIALNHFGKSESSRNSHINDADDKIRVAPFGSFATQSVCTFASDVDICLWGVVKGEKQSEHITFVDADAGCSQKIDDDVNNSQYQHDVCPLLTESQLLRTMEAIQNISQHPEQNIDAPGSDNNDEETQTIPGNDLFYIDRVGESIDDVEEQGNVLCKVAETPSNTAAIKPFETDFADVKLLGCDLDDLDRSTCTEFRGEKDQYKEVFLKSEQQCDVACNENDEGTVEGAIEIDDSIDENEESDIIVVDSDYDDADKLASYYSRQSNSSATDNPNSGGASFPSNSIHEDDSSRESARIGVDDNDDFNSCQQPQENEVLELSLTSGQSATKPNIGPTGKIRNRVVSVLLSLTNQLRRSSFTHTIECRSRARVPIINCSTRTGFEGDIAIGGHNGVDTSLYAESQVDRFNSFAPIVLLMKVLMNQQGLDKPYTGGLGSYKLYVLVAYHIETHIKNGGNDRPSEILISLLYRFGYICSRGDKLTTDLIHLKSLGQILTSDGGVCELTPVFRLPDCVDLFRECYERLSDRCLLIDNLSGGHQCSYLSSIIDCFSLRETREASMRQARLCDDITRPIPRDHPGKVSAGRRISYVFTRNGNSSSLKHENNKRKKSTSRNPKSYKRSKSDVTNRGPRGGLVPKSRPDLAARKSLGTDAALIQRGMKQRKNKKKQERDKELTRFASRHSI